MNKLITLAIIAVFLYIISFAATHTPKINNGVKQAILAIVAIVALLLAIGVLTGYVPSFRYT